MVSAIDSPGTLCMFHLQLKRWRGFLVFSDCPCCPSLHEHHSKVPRILHFLFYILPMLGAFVYGLIVPGCTWMPDWTVFEALPSASGPTSGHPSTHVLWSHSRSQARPSWLSWQPTCCTVMSVGGAGRVW
ncbi:transmembrane 6 superfamily member 2 [Salmo trutta]|uniref:transmembrane 6 superfamily member 2 n=1 Tax=Salmo trutta TaxID=8032 RepID=UPI00112FFAD4|nr:transmembrane 6 superfamily member 1-like [Salmo trutta]